MKIKAGDLVRVRDDAGRLHNDNAPYEGQLGIVEDVRNPATTDYPYHVKMLSDGNIMVFDDEEIEYESR